MLQQVIYYNGSQSLHFPLYPLQITEPAAKQGCNVCWAPISLFDHTCGQSRAA